MKVQYILELLGTGFFAMSGALVANEKSKPDWFGVSFIGFITSIGGGSLRDMLLGSYPLVWIKDINFIYAVFTGIILTSVLYQLLTKNRKMLLVFDTLGIAMFTIIGMEKALNLGVDPIIACIMGMFSAVMGGVLRDVLTNETPILFQKTIYASACLAGTVVYLLLDVIGLERHTTALLSIGVICAIRYVAVRYNVTLPKFRKE